MKKAWRFCDLPRGRFFENLRGDLYIKRSEITGQNRITGSLVDFGAEDIVFTEY